MKKLSDFQGQKIAIHFPTYELWLRRKEINPSDTCEDSFWEHCKEKMSCSLFYSGDSGGFADIDYYKRQGFTILPATDFLEEEFVYGQEYEFSDNENFKYKEKSKFISKLPDGYFVSFYEENGAVKTWKYCRKINTERNEAITTAKELITKFDIK